MSDIENQYNSPETQVVPEKVQTTGNITETMLRYLNQTAPWLQFIGIVGFISCGLIIIGGLFSSVGLFISSGMARGLGFFPVWLLSPVNIALGVIIFFPSYFTYNFGAKIRKYNYSNSPEDLEEAFKNNKSLWKFNGIMYIISISFIPLMIVILIFIGIAAAIQFF